MKIFNAVDYGICPNKDISKFWHELIRNVSYSDEEKTITLDKGVYHFYVKNSPDAYLRVTNSCGEGEWDEGEVKNHCRVSTLIEDVKNLTIDGNGSVFILHGKYTNIAIRNSENIAIKNLIIQTDNPNIHEFKVTNKGIGFVDFEIDKDSKYVNENGKFYFIGDGYKLDFMKDRKKYLWIGRIDGNNTDILKVQSIHPLKRAISFKELSPYLFRAIMPSIGFQIGDRFYILDVIRKNHGVFIDKSKNISLINFEQNFNYGLAVVAQDSENIKISDSRFCPNPEGSKLITSIADFVQISMCRGDVEIEGNLFEGSCDDALNVHGVHYKISDIQGNKITVKYCHHQTSGFCPFREGDIIKIVNPDTLVEHNRTTLKSAKLVDENTIELELVSVSAEVGMVVENLSACPNLIYKNNIINRIMTRGILVTTSGKVVVEKNEFRSTSSNSIVISDDAALWYESGNVANVEIKNNKFSRCIGYTLYVKPENKKYSSAVHKNIRFIDNIIDSKGEGGFFIKDSEKVIIKGNRILSKTRKTKTLRSNVVFDDNIFEGK